jgi:hypothetical protein
MSTVKVQAAMSESSVRPETRAAIIKSEIIFFKLDS